MIRLFSDLLVKHYLPIAFLMEMLLHEFACDTLGFDILMGLPMFFLTIAP